MGYFRYLRKEGFIDLNPKVAAPIDEPFEETVKRNAAYRRRQQRRYFIIQAGKKGHKHGAAQD